MADTNTMSVMKEIAARIIDLRQDFGYTLEQVAEYTGFSLEECTQYEEGEIDLPFSYLHKCALLFGVDIVDLLEGSSPRLSSYVVTRRGKGPVTAHEPGTEIRAIAPLFKDRMAAPYWVTYEYDEALLDQPIHQVTHAGQEFDLVMEGRMRIKVGENEEVLGPGDSILYNSSTPHGMIAIDGKDVTFVAVILAEDEEENVWEGTRMRAAADVDKTPVQPEPEYIPAAGTNFVADFIDVEENEQGAPLKMTFKNTDRFNFAFDVVDAIAAQEPDRLAMVHLDREKNERRFTFEDMSKMSSRAANYFRALGIKKGDRVMLVLRRNWQFWPIIVGLCKVGAVPIPATDQLLQKDYEYRFETAKISAVVCTSFGHAVAEVDKAAANYDGLKLKVTMNNAPEGWHSFDDEYEMYRSSFPRTEDSIAGGDTMIMLFSSGTSGYPKAVVHSCLYPLGHYATAKYWHGVDPNGIHFTISDTGWGKALWGKLYGQWMCGGAVFVYDFDRFSADDILPLLAQYHITTFCAPPTMYRFFIREDLSKYDFSTLKRCCSAGEALNPEVFELWRANTGLSIMEAFGQTETCASIGTFTGTVPRPGSMGRPAPQYEVELFDIDGNRADNGIPGEICIKWNGGAQVGLAKGYLDAPEATAATWHDGWYHSGDMAWRDEDGYLWYVGRTDDIIKSSGYRIGPFEIESVIMELPYVLECGVSGQPDEVRGQVVKASVVLVKGTEPSDELAQEIKDYVKSRTAPYKYPRIVVFRDELPKSTSGKIQHQLL